MKVLLALKKLNVIYIYSLESQTVSQSGSTRVILLFELDYHIKYDRLTIAT